MNGHASTIWTLKGSSSKENAERKMAVLLSLLEIARSRSGDIARLRQTNFNYALAIFAGLFSFTLRFATGWYSVWIASALLAMMGFFAVLDRKFHRYVHGWRKTEKLLVNTMVSTVDDPSKDTEFVRYCREGEDSAEKFGSQPMMTYLLVIGAAVHLIRAVALAMGTH